MKSVAVSVCVWLIAMLVFAGVFMIVHDVGRGTVDGRTWALLALDSCLIAVIAGVVVDGKQ